MNCFADPCVCATAADVRDLGINIGVGRGGFFLEECGSGVNIFFFISGFILAIPFFRDYVYNQKKVSLKHYYYRRLTRIEPPYIISLIFFLLVAIFLMRQPTIDALKHFAASAFYSHNVIYNHISTINPVAWTLEIEVQYYLIAPLIAVALFFKNRIARTISLLLLFILSGTLYFQNADFFEQHHLTKSLLAYSSIFVAGTWYGTVDFGGQRKISIGGGDSFLVKLAP